jgi:hypothetical protein
VRRLALLMAVTAAALSPVAASASETVTYTYDAKGRLITVSHSGSANNGLTAAYTFDKADNRLSATVSGSQFSAPAGRVIVTSLRGGSVIAF